MKYKNLYETVLIFKGTFNEDKYKQALNKTIERIIVYADIMTISEKGKKKLAYEISKNKVGYYVVIDFKETSESIVELERLFRISEDIIKFIVVRRDN